MNSTADTITPVIRAMGMSWDNINLFSRGKTMVIVEGVSDSYYMRAAAIQIGVEDKLTFIPSAGVSNISNLLSILIGWGCDVRVIIDQDNAGRKEYKKIINNKLLTNDNIIFIDGKDKVGVGTVLIEYVFSEKDREYIGINLENYEDEKAYYSFAIMKKMKTSSIN